VRLPRDEAVVVVALYQVRELVDDDVLEALHRLLGELLANGEESIYEH
jgi:hypothetical protein